MKVGLYKNKKLFSIEIPNYKELICGDYEFNSAKIWW